MHNSNNNKNKKIKCRLKTIDKLIKFLGLGLSSYGINLFITYLFNNILNYSSDFSYFVSIIIITIYNFIISFKLIFKVDFKYYLLIKYLFVLFSFSGINYFLVIYLKNYFGEEYLYIIIVLIITVLAIIKFFVYDRFVFNKNKKG